METVSGIGRVTFPTKLGIDNSAKTYPFVSDRSVHASIPIGLHIAHYVEGIHILDTDGVGYGPTVSVCQNRYTMVGSICTVVIVISFSCNQITVVAANIGIGCRSRIGIVRATE